MSERQNTFPPSVNVGRLYERTSSKGNPYLSGFFGSMKIAALKSKDTDAEGNPIWNLMIAAAPSRDRAGNNAGRKAEAERPRDPDGSRGRPAMRASSLTVDDEIPF